MEAILTVPFVVTTCILHLGNQMDCLNLRLSSINAAASSKVRKHLDTPHHMSAPPLARHICLAIGDAMLF